VTKLSPTKLSPLKLPTKKVALLILAALAFCVSLAAPQPCKAQLPPSTVSADGASATAPHLKVSLVASAAMIAPGAGFQTGLHFQLDKGWHVYWVNAGDSGEPPTIKWTLPKGITAGPMQFPAPQRLPLGPLMDFGYPDEVLYPIDMEVAPDFKPGAPAVLAGQVDWLVCRESCIPGRAFLSLKLPTAATPAVNQARLSLIQTWNRRIPKPLPQGDEAAYSDKAEPFRLIVHTASPAAEAQFFPLDQNQIDNDAPQIITSENGGVILDIKKDPELKTPPDVLNGVVVFRDGVAFEVHAKRGPLRYLAASALPGARPTTSLLQALGLALIGGIILNLMPCVFPVLFIKALSLVQSSQTERKHMRLHGLVYTLGILASFWVVVAVLLILRAGGQRLGWGFQFQSPEFLAVMALLLFFLGLSLAGMFEIGLTLTSAGGSLAQKQGYSGSFFTGVLAMVVATPCTAPFMGVAIGYALAEPSWVSFLVFTALGVGLAAPYLLLAFQPAWTRILPRPGAWMEVLKQATAVPIFATVIWLVWLFTSSTDASALAGLLLAFLLLGIAGWVLGRWPAQRVPLLAAVVVIAAAVAAPIYATHRFAQPVQASSRAGVASPKDWQPFTPTIVASYQAQGKPVLVDFTAAWCLSCQVNEKVVLDRPEVESRLHSSGIALVRADWTHHDDDIAQALSQLGRSGVPAYALYPANAGGPPVMLPEVLTPGIIYDAVDRVAGQRASLAPAPK
jgi:thiol:disulfide interchange protein DsbD